MLLLIYYAQNYPGIIGASLKVVDDIHYKYSNNANTNKLQASQKVSVEGRI